MALGLLLCLISINLGCQESSSRMQVWMEGKGGAVVDARENRAQRIVAGFPREVVGMPLTVQVLASDELCAYAWPSGNLFVTQALVDRLDDQELTAAIAHEIGHLPFISRAPAVQSLQGNASTTPGLAEEERADTVGVELLVNLRVPASSMTRMLNKVMEFGSPSPTTRCALQQRIERLSAMPAIAPPKPL